MRFGLVAVSAAIALLTATGAAAIAAPRAARPSALTSKGLLFAWGANGSGQLGNGGMTNSDVPVKVKLPKGTRVVEDRSGCFFTVALTSTGEVLAWGLNFDGQLGDGSLTSSKTPVRVRIPAHTRITHVRAGCAFGLALTSKGQVLAWGYNDLGQLGDGRVANALKPVKVKLPKNTVVTGISAGESHGLALTSKGQVLAWGDNGYGELGNGRTNNNGSDVPVRVKLPRSVRVAAVAGGVFYSLAETTSGGVLAWGYNQFGELGNGTVTNTDVPVRVKLPAGTKVNQLYAGGYHGLALSTKGQVFAWGYNFAGQLGNGNTNSSDRPVKVKLPAGTKVTAIAACLTSSMALTSKGRVLAWGGDAYGQLGNGTITTAPFDLPVRVKLPATVLARNVACGPDGSVGLAIEA
jgi:alpha-tubulin suppressor-like RCC1 family protein